MLISSCESTDRRCLWALIERCLSLGLLMELCLSLGLLSFRGSLVLPPVSVLRFCTLGAPRFLRDSGSSIGASLLHKSSSSCLVLPTLAFAREERLFSDDIESRWLDTERRSQTSGTPLRTLNDTSGTSGIVVVPRRWELDSLRLSLRADSYDEPACS